MRPVRTQGQSHPHKPAFTGVRSQGNCVRKNSTHRVGRRAGQLGLERPAGACPAEPGPLNHLPAPCQPFHVSQGPGTQYLPLLFSVQPYRSRAGSQL